MYFVYSKAGCVYCKRAKDAIEQNEKKYRELQIDRDIDRSEFIRAFPNVKSVPHITLLNDDGTTKSIGSYTDLMMHLSNRGSDVEHE